VPGGTAFSWLPPTTVAVPILGAALLLAVGRWLPRWLTDAIPTAVAAGITVLTACLLARTADGHVVTWSGGWRPTHGFSVGIVMVSDPVGAGAALLSAALATLALLYSWKYFESVEAHYHALVLLFLAGMQGFALTGDLFDMFVFFELMGASAYALTGMKVEDPSALQGALNFGIINSLGAYLTLAGVGLLYARTGNLGMPQLHQSLEGRPVDALVVAAFVLVLTGFLVKGAVAPFHYWLDDAHAVAPAPVCVLFSGIMVPLGVYGALRVYWIVFAGVLPGADIRRAFLVLGVISALVGAVMCVGQRHIKRLLAFSTIAHAGLFLCALALLSEDGTAGALLYVAGHAGAKAALFLLAGLLLNRFGSVDEHGLYGRGRSERLMPWLWVLGALALAGLPPFGTALGKAISEEAAIKGGDWYLSIVFVAVSGLTGGAVLRVAARIYLGLGPRPREGEAQAFESTGEEKSEARLRSAPATMVVPIVALLAGTLVAGVIGGSRSAFSHAAAYFTQPGAYVHAAMTLTAGTVSSVRQPNWTGLGLGLGFVSVAVALVTAAAGVYSSVLADRLAPLVRVGSAPMRVLRQLHSGHVGDYVAWLMTGVAVVGALVGLPLVR